jgi:hypothetical protein
MVLLVRPLSQIGDPFTSPRAHLVGDLRVLILLDNLNTGIDGDAGAGPGVLAAPLSA